MFFIGAKKSFRIFSNHLISIRNPNLKPLSQYHNINPIPFTARLLHTTSAPEEKPAINNNDRINKLNEAFKNHPIPVLGCIVGMDFAAMMGTFGLLTAFNITAPAQFALAFIISRPLRKFRLPLDIGVAIFLAKQFPILQEIKLKYWLESLTEYLRQNQSKSSFTNKLLEKLSHYVSRYNEYAVSFLLSSRIVGAGVVFGTYFLLNLGFDPSYGGTIGETVGTWSLAVVLSSLIWPLNVYAAILMGGRIGKWFKKSDQPAS